MPPQLCNTRDRTCSRLFLLGIPSNASRVRPGGSWGLLCGPNSGKDRLTATEGRGPARESCGQGVPIFTPVHCLLVRTPGSYCFPSAGLLSFSPFSRKKEWRAPQENQLWYWNPLQRPSSGWFAREGNQWGREDKTIHFLGRQEKSSSSNSPNPLSCNNLFLYFTSCMKYFLLFKN